MSHLQEDIRNIISASHPIVYINTDEELEVFEMISQEANDYLIFSYDEVEGVKWVNEENFEQQKQLRLKIRNQIEGLNSNLYETLLFIKDISTSERTVLSILSADTLFKEENPQRQANIRFIKNLINGVKNGEILLSIFLISDTLTIPSLLEKDTIIFETAYPTRNEIRQLLDDFLNEQSLTLLENIKSEFVSSLQGLTKSEIENLLYLAVNNDGVLDENDIDFFIDYKKQIVKKKFNNRIR